MVMKQALAIYSKVEQLEGTISHKELITEGMKSVAKTLLLHRQGKYSDAEQVGALTAVADLLYGITGFNLVNDVLDGYKEE